MKQISGGAGGNDYQVFTASHTLKGPGKDQRGINSSQLQRTEGFTPDGQPSAEPQFPDSEALTPSTVDISTENFHYSTKKYQRVPKTSYNL